jgi:uncharacterized membrane-anchored protein YjiN (DUF445 family)
MPALGEAASRNLLDDGQACSKADRLRRMQRLATSLLALMLVLLLVSATCQASYPWLHWIRAFAEAAAVGAMADWFAVTAMFRHPLGLAIPHTAIIPGNKDRIGESLGDFVEQNFLTPEKIVARLQQHDAARVLARWLAAPANSLALARGVADFLPAMLDGLGDRQLRRFFDRALMPQVLTLDVARMAGNLLTVLTQDDRHQALLDRALRALEGWLVAKEGLIRAKFSEASRFTPVRLDSYVVNRFIQGIIALLHDVVENPSHELRGQFDEAVRSLIHDLLNSEDYRRKGEVLLQELVEHLRGENTYRRVWEALSRRVRDDVESDSSLIRRHLAGALVALGERLLEEPGMQQKLNAWWLTTIRRIAVRYRRQISSMITEVVKSWDAEQVSRKVELEIGRDLQYIRINGTFVGGTVGLFLHAGLHVLSVAKAA